MTLIVGLGNPTDKYKNNRHNIGFMAVDRLLKSNSFADISKSRFKGELYKKNSLLLLKPHTYMNLSGESVISVVNYYEIDKIIVIHDELDINFGEIKYKKGGGNGGHNGLKSIDKHIGKDYIRVRVGIGKPKDRDVVAHVLKDFSKEEFTKLEEILEYVEELTLKLVEFDIDEVKKRYPVKKVLFE
jgi:PTH1 family peptidyl-tRNA hydrolase